MPHDTASPAVRHHPFLMFLHWITLAAMLSGIVMILLREDMEVKSTRVFMLDMHRAFGLLVLGLLALRLAVRLWHAKSAPDHDLPPMMSLLSKLGHYALYLMLVVVPLLGWAQSSAQSASIRLFRILPIPSLTSQDLDLADRLADYHYYAACAIGVLIVLHTLAALWHHYVRRDHVLRSMLPRMPRADKSAPAAKLTAFSSPLPTHTEQKP